MSQTSTAATGPVEAAGRSVAELLCDHYDRLRRVAMATAPAGHADDVVQEACARIIERSDQLRDPQAFQAWASQIVRSVAMRQWRGARREQPAADTPHATDVDTPEARLVRTEETRQMTQALSSLGHRDRAMLADRYLSSMTVPELADRFDLTQQSMSNALMRARQRARAALERVALVLPARAFVRPGRPNVAPTWMALLGVRALEVGAALSAIVLLGGGAPAAAGVESAPGLVAHVTVPSTAPAQAVSAGDVPAAPAGRSVSEVAEPSSNTVDVAAGTPITTPDQAPPGEDVSVTVAAGGAEVGAKVYADDAEEATGAEVDAHVTAHGAAPGSGGG